MNLVWSYQVTVYVFIDIFIRYIPSILAQFNCLSLILFVALSELVTLSLRSLAELFAYFCAFARLT